MARRLQEEFYGAGSGMGVVRVAVARDSWTSTDIGRPWHTTETLVGPGAFQDTSGEGNEEYCRRADGMGGRIKLGIPR